ncbi:MAG: type II toxin-antitoxin system HicA family toxin [Burkholderiaceae bacterium]|nr:type II toxin-antitoxin system HicA family toxin [Burkholderiaceae bacterium]
MVGILLSHGCEMYGQRKGSHEMWKSPVNGARFPVSVNIVSRAIANKILKTAGISKKLP